MTDEVVPPRSIKVNQNDLPPLRWCRPGRWIGELPNRAVNEAPVMVVENQEDIDDYFEFKETRHD